jgi:monoamine oxidase
MTTVIIGAGLAGLTAAATLSAQGESPKVLEAEAIIGGRIRALRNPVDGSALADLGPSWVWPRYQPVAARWLDRLDIATFDQFNDGDAVLEGFGPRPLHQPLPGQDGMRRISGGPSALIDRLAARIGMANIRTSAPVREIGPDGPDRVAVRLHSGETLRADRVIVAIPLRVAAATLHLPWLPANVLDILRRTPTWMAAQAKAVAVYDQPFWRAAGLSGRIASRTGPLVEAHDHCGANGTPAAIFGFVGWPPSDRRANLAGLKQAILDQLVDCFGPGAGRPSHLVVQDWATIPTIASPLDLAGNGGHPEIGPPELRRWHLDGRVRFAVSEVSDTSPGLIEGALSAGEGAARDLLANGL